MTDKRALVLGGGGVTGIAWENGVVAGLADAGVDITDADLIIGTSAGANVAVQIASGASPEQLFQRQVDPELQSRELFPAGDSSANMHDILTAIFTETDDDPAQRRLRLGRMALDAPTVAGPVRRAVIESRLPVRVWPDRPLLIAAVEAETGEPRLFDRSSGAGLVDVVAASSAVPGIWPPVTIDGVRYVDGGVRSGCNADYALGYERVLVVAPMPDDPDLAQQITVLLDSGARVEVITLDEAAHAAAGDNPLDPSARVPVAHAGRAQGKAESARIAALWL
ncbi:patatin-like phospholipase family protein [Nocardia jejuensis]|uniref:patatin-like phospholipase family protein n=1 Tax=Nocardia jejuensis TaxID=328049 RepID=UPI000833EA98|nr:patatin-like phospholipase family protein [Nocardia jejuensis]